MSGPLRTGLWVLALAAAGCAGAPPPPAVDARAPVRVRVEMLGGFAAERAPLPPGRVALVVDSTASMARATAAGPSRIRGARAAARRFVSTLPAATPLDLYVTGNDRGAACDDPITPRDGDRDDFDRGLARIRSRGEGSLATALAALPGAAEDGGYERVVAVSAFDDGCGDDLCPVAQGLADRGVRVDWVRIGEVPLPECLTELTRGLPAAPPVPWDTARPVPFHVQTAGADPAIVVCGESGGLPVQLAPGRAEVVVKLDPPLRVPRNFLPGTRWVLQVIDFPGLDPPERQWRWHADAAPAGTGALAAGGEAAP
ncbi:MAG: hypothetical protein ACQGVC_02140 [Myxococcota bacterium]